MGKTGFCLPAGNNFPDSPRKGDRAMATRSGISAMLIRVRNTNTADRESEKKAKKLLVLRRLHFLRKPALEVLLILS
jgi:hypothetical protein